MSGIDHLKQLNDQHGHLACLKSFEIEVIQFEKLTLKLTVSSGVATTPSSKIKMKLWRKQLQPCR
jgi:hypothetical protein